MTLVDTVVALALLLLGTATIGRFLVQQIHAGGSNAAFSKAYTLAAEELEDLRGLDYGDIGPRSSSLKEGALTYAVKTSVAADTPGPNMKQITVDVSWNEPGASQHVTVETIYTAVQR